jgi:isocitrate lyase
MFKLDQQFLEELGLDQLPDDQKQAFLDHIYSQLELRVGTRLSDGLSEAQLSEFESFIDRDDEKVRGWIDTNAPEYVNDPAFVQLREGAPEGTTETVLLAEYASLRWLAMNRPDYRDVVKQVLDEIKQEILSNRDAIIGN